MARALANGLLLLPLLGLVGAKSPHDKYKKVPLRRHSFVAPLEYKTLLDDWEVSGASLFERYRLLLHPGVSERHGFAWNKHSVLTSDFEVSFSFKTSGETDVSKVNPDQSFSFWYTEENVTSIFKEDKAIKAKSWKKGMEAQGFTLGGFQAHFKGFGVVFSMSDHRHSLNPSVSFARNDGNKVLTWWLDVPASDAKALDFRNSAAPVQLKLRVRQAKVEAFLKLTPTGNWVSCLKGTLPEPVKAGGFLGFTAWSGDQAEGHKPDQVSIQELFVMNYDDSVVGEEVLGDSQAQQSQYEKLMTEDVRHLQDQRSQTEQLAKLTVMLDEYVSNIRPESEQMYEEILALDTRLTRLDKDCRTVVHETKVFAPAVIKDGRGHPHAHLESMKVEIIGLRKLLMKDSVSQKQKLEAVKSKVSDVKEKKRKALNPVLLSKLQEQSKSLEKTVKSRGVQLSWILIALVASVLAIGALMWNRMRYYEKKHFI